MAFATQEDIGNRALQHCGARLIQSFSQASTNRNAQQVSFAYDKLRAAELRRSVWRFATRRAVLRPISPSSFLFIPAVWSGGTNYVAGQIVSDTSGVYWISTRGTLNQPPGVPIPGVPTPWEQYFGPYFADTWSKSTAYYAGDMVYVTTSPAPPVFYLSVANNNVGLSPTVASQWRIQTPAFTPIGVTLLSPAGPGLTVNGVARNMFPLPNGFLRLAAADPRVDSTPNLVTTGALQYSDWMLENNVLISAEPTAIVPFRFVADLVDVPAMDPLFCEALGARIGYEICEALTQSDAKKKDIGAAYQKFMRDARLVNQIETASTEPMEDDLPLMQGPAATPAGAPAA